MKALSSQKSKTMSTTTASVKHVWLEMDTYTSLPQRVQDRFHEEILQSLHYNVKELQPTTMQQISTPIQLIFSSRRCHITSRIRRFSVTRKNVSSPVNGNSPLHKFRQRVVYMSMGARRTFVCSCRISCGI